MKTMFPVLLVSIFLSSALCAQTTHQVDVANFSFTPANLQIEPGDAVRWVNSEGTHNVDGSLEIFPDNPEAFGNDVAPAPWSYQVTFDTEGEYNYICGIHVQMTGSITVGEVNSTSNLNVNPISIYPNPVSDIIQIKGLEAYKGSLRIEFYDLQGKLIHNEALFSESQIDLSEFSNGVLFFNVYENGLGVNKGKIVKED